MEDLSKKIKIALSFLRERHFCMVDNLKLGITDDENLYVTGWSSALKIESLTKKIATNELNAVKDHFFDLVNNFPELKKFVKSKKIKYNLAFNYGMGSIAICYEFEDLVFWEITMQE